MDDRRTIPRLPARERAPQFLACAFVERHARGARAAHHTDQPVAIHQRMRRRTPLGDFQIVRFLEILLPQDCAILGRETKQMSFCPERVHTVAIYRGRGSRADGVGGHGGVRTIPLLRPEHASSHLIEAL